MGRETRMKSDDRHAQGKAAAYRIFFCLHLLASAHRRFDSPCSRAVRNV